MEPSWVQEIYGTCRLTKVPLIFKQWAGVRKELSGRTFRGKTFDEMPIVQYRT